MVGHWKACTVCTWFACCVYDLRIVRTSLGPLRHTHCVFVRYFKIRSPVLRHFRDRFHPIKSSFCARLAEIFMRFVGMPKIFLYVRQFFSVACFGLVVQHSTAPAIGSVQSDFSAEYTTLICLLMLPEGRKMEQLSDVTRSERRFV